MRVTSRLPGQQSTGSRNCQIRSQHNGRDPAEVLTNHVFSLCECERFGSASTCAQGDAVGNGRGGCFAKMRTNPCARNLSTANVSAELKCQSTARAPGNPGRYSYTLPKQDRAHLSGIIYLTQGMVPV